MKKILPLIPLAFLASCVVQQLNRANDLMYENIQTMEASRASIEENTLHIQRSTATMQEFQFIFPVVFCIIVFIAIFIFYKFSKKIMKFIKERRKE